MKKLKDILEESSGLANIGKKIAELTDTNNHTEALMLAAKSIGATKYVKVLGHVKDIQKLEGYLPHLLSNYVYSIQNQLKEFGVQKFGDDYITLIHNNL